MKKLIAMVVLVAMSLVAVDSAEACGGRRAARAARAVASKVRIFKHHREHNAKASACASGACKK